MKPQITAIIQARMGSTRLPGKGMMPLAGRPLLGHVFERIQLTRGVDRVVLATCGGDENSVIISLAESMGIPAFIGPEDNVLERFYLAAQEFGGDYIMRVTGDNPFTDPDYAAMSIDAILKTGSDLCYFSNLPLGTGVGMVKRSALDTAYRKSDKPHQHEHVTPYIREHPEEFKIEIGEIEIYNPFPELRLTVDTPEDFQLADILYRHLYRGKPFPLRDVISFLEQNPGIAAINSSIKQRPMTHSSSQ
ncbi:MAG: glycosyltransferase family protein [Spirochaetes bacterium]|nr:glycosyltransferase family protein [Spirochaetota bacterium]